MLNGAQFGDRLILICRATCPRSVSRSIAPLLRGESPSDWRTSVYYRYYHDPGDHNTAAHFGVRTATHKLIYFWGKNAYEMFDLSADPTEQHNLLFDAAEAKRPEIAASRSVIGSARRRLIARGRRGRARRCGVSIQNR